MTRYEMLEALEKEAREKSLKTSDENLKKFYKNAEIGFQNKKRKLTIDQACSKVL